MSRKLEIFGMTDVGQVRDHNEDNFVICKDLKQKDWSYARDKKVELGPWGTLLVVADGMGGTNAGEVASHIAQETVKKTLNALEAIPESDKKREDLLKKIIREAHDEIVKHQQKNLETAGMGTTLVIAWIIGDKLHVAWSGDSRCYVHRKGEDLHPFSEDHSLVWNLVKAGEISPEEARTHNESNIITQSLGEPSRPPKPSAKTTELHPGDQVLVCSDGLNGMLSDEQIQYFLDQNKSVADICNDLTAAANKAGGTDNITVLMARILGDPAPSEATTMKGLNKEIAESESSTASQATRTQVLRKKVKVRNYLMFGLLIALLILLAKFFLYPVKGNKKTVIINLEPKTYAFTPDVLDTLNLSEFLLNRPDGMDSFGVDGIEYQRVSPESRIAFMLKAESAPTATVQLYPSLSDTIYIGKIHFVQNMNDKSFDEADGTRRTPQEDRADERDDAPLPMESNAEPGQNIRENEQGDEDTTQSIAPGIDTISQQNITPIDVPDDPVINSKPPLDDSMNTGLPPLNKLNEKEDTIQDNNQINK